ncbi:DUF805 domain-containing protein [Mucilaginibacter gilvus]|uniref:DUF805 domain-containing protein n=1 Tax=Mucilaginibacter gilvus TaxID=2305909 RepID=A0A444MSZ0_9SPHI|nr:DUF805 domain-containing protein [Mucilaginibacter gilvus]RWY55736.1 DUF805 domain-containing protein [Mucilaginibacter gilvus]
MFTNPFVFYGRIRRMEFGLSLLIYIVVFIFVVVQVADHHKEMYLLALFPLGWFRYAQGAKRCHDLGNSGWWQLIPFYGFWLLLEDGKIGPNQYGENPKDNNYPNYPNYTYKNPMGPPGAGDPNY